MAMRRNGSARVEMCRVVVGVVVVEAGEMTRYLWALLAMLASATFSLF